MDDQGPRREEAELRSNSRANQLRRLFLSTEVAKPWAHSTQQHQCDNGINLSVLKVKIIFAQLMMIMKMMDDRVTIPVPTAYISLTFPQQSMSPIINIDSIEPTRTSPIHTHNPLYSLSPEKSGRRVAVSTQ